MLDLVLNKRLVIFSGKGGVGKTTMAISLGLMAARLGKKTLLVEMNSPERVAGFFGLKAIGYKETVCQKNLSGINVNPKDCFEEYILQRIHFKKVFDTFVNNRFVTSFLNAVPGFNELMMVGKIYDLAAHRHSQKPYDLIIVDGPATGHGASAFEVPQIVYNAVKVGPLHSQSKKMIDFLQDKTMTVFCPVTLLEEMPIVEMTELISRIKAKLGIGVGPIFVNAYQKNIFSKEEEKTIFLEKNVNEKLKPYFIAAQFLSHRLGLQEKMMELLQRLNPGSPYILAPKMEAPIQIASDLLPIVDAWTNI